MTDLKRIEKYLLAQLQYEAKIYFIEFLNYKKDVVKLEYYYKYFTNPQTKDKRKQKIHCLLARDYIRVFFYLYNPYWDLSNMWDLDYNDPQILGKSMFIFNEFDKVNLTRYPWVNGLLFVSNFIKKSREILLNN